MKTLNNSRILIVSSFTLALVFIAGGYFLFGNRDASPEMRGDALVDLVDAPRSYDEFTDVDLIVVGRIGGVGKEGMEGPYNETGLLHDSRDVPLPRLYFTYFEILIDEIILPDTDRIQGDPVLLRLNGKVGGRQANFMPMPEDGLNAMFALRRNPDKLSYGAGPWGIVNLKGEFPKFNDWDAKTVDFGQRDNVEDFIKNVRSHVSNRDQGQR